MTFTRITTAGTGNMGSQVANQIELAGAPSPRATSTSITFRKAVLVSQPARVSLATR
jgi:hypothetical protein